MDMQRFSYLHQASYPVLATLLTPRSLLLTHSPTLITHTALLSLSIVYSNVVDIGLGTITSNSVFLLSSSFESNPPTFALVGDTIGGPPTTYTWTRNGVVITNGGPFRISIALNGDNEDTSIRSLYRSTLTVTGYYPGAYTYSVTNRATTSAMSRTFSIESGNFPTNLVAIQNGFDTVLVSWTSPPGGSYRVRVHPGDISQTATSSPQAISLQQPGVYNISVMSFSQHYPGGTAGPVAVTVTRPLPPTVNVSSITASTVNVSWTQPPFSFTPAYTVTMIRVTGSGQVLCSTVPDSRLPVTPMVTSVEFTDLQEFSTYRVTVSARFSEFGSLITEPSSVEFSTLSTNPIGAPRNVVFSSTSRNISVSWDAIECVERNGVITGYIVEFQEQNGTRIPGEVIDQTFTAGGLIPHTNYTFRVAGVNINGMGPFSDISIITTDEELPGPVSEFTAEPLTSVLLTWSPPLELNGGVVAYEVSYSVNGNETVAVNFTASITTLFLSSVASDYSIRAYTSAGPGAASVYYLNTSFPVPSMVMNVLVEQLTDTSVRVSWRQISSNNITSYIVFYKLSNNTEHSEESITVPRTRSSVVIGDLMSNVEYQFQVAAIAELNGLSYTGQRSFQAQMSISSMLSGTQNFGLRDFSIAVALTFLFTVVLYSSILLVVCGVVYVQHSKKRKEKDSSNVIAMDENAAYSVSISQQPHDYIYAQPVL